MIVASVTVTTEIVHGSPRRMAVGTAISTRTQTTLNGRAQTPVPHGHQSQTPAAAPMRPVGMISVTSGVRRLRRPGLATLRRPWVISVAALRTGTRVSAPA